MRDVAEQAATMIVWPEPLPGATLTPSPFVDELNRKTEELKHKTVEFNLLTTELEETRSKLNMLQLCEEESMNRDAEQGGKAWKTNPGGYSE